MRGQIVQVRASGEPLATLVCSDEVYLVPRADGTVLLGSTVELVGFRKEVTAGAVRMLLASAARLVPSIAAARFVTAWAGLRPGTPDGLPILGASPVAGLFFAAGHFRNGILLAPAHGKAPGRRDCGQSRRERARGVLDRAIRRSPLLGLTTCPAGQDFG